MRRPSRVVDDALLFGAGASKEAGLPDTYELTERILRSFDRGPANERAALQLVIGGLIFQRGIEKRDPLERPDAEAVFRALQALAGREKFDAAPFVSWHPAIHALESACEIDSKSGLNIYGQTNRRLLTVLCELLWLPRDSSKSIAYLDPLRSILKRQGSVWVGTLNYDNVLERFAERVGADYSTGLDSKGFNVRQGYSFRFTVGGFHILKLHGSLNWTLHSPGTSSTPGVVPQPFVLQRDAPPSYASMSEAEPALLFGDSKLTARGPFLTLLTMFRAALRNATRLTVVGYSFRDDHVNAQIANFLNEQSWSRLTIIDPCTRGLPEFVDQMLRACGDRVTLLRKTAGEGLREVFNGPSDR
jgi:hypothetical protein